MSNRRSALTDQGQSQVQRIINRGQERIARRATDGRGRSGNGGKRGVDNRGVGKKTLPLPQTAREQIERIAKAENVPQGDVVTVAVAMLDELHRAGKIDLDQFKELVYSDTQSWRSSTHLVMPEDYIFFGD